MHENAKVFICSAKGYTQEQSERHFELLPSWRKERILNLKNKQNRKENILAFTLLTSVLKSEFGIDCFSFKYNKHGKPYLTEGEVYFNISHCEKAVTVGVSAEEIGVDVECIQVPRNLILSRFFTETEQDIVNKSLNPALSFTKIWTEKESKAKCLGYSILTPQTCFNASEYLVSGVGYDAFYVSACIKNTKTPVFINVDYNFLVH